MIATEEKKEDKKKITQFQTLPRRAEQGKCTNSCTAAATKRTLWEWLDQKTRPRNAHAGERGEVQKVIKKSARRLRPGSCGPAENPAGWERRGTSKRKKKSS